MEKLSAHRRRRRRRHLEIQVDVQARKLCLEFSYGFGVVVRDLGEWRPGFYTEFRCASREHSGLPWGAIFEKVIQNKEIHTFGKENTLILRFPCSFFQEQVPKMCSFATVAPSKEH